MIVGDDRSFESGSFTPAAGPPSGSATAPPASGGTTLYYETATLPKLAGGTTYVIEPYDDACKETHVAGSFST